MSQSKKLLTVKSVAERLGINQKTVRRWINNDKLKGQRIGRRIYTTERALDEFARYSTLQAQTRRVDRSAAAAEELNRLLGRN